LVCCWGVVEDGGKDFEGEFSDKKHGLIGWCCLRVGFENGFRIDWKIGQSYTACLNPGLGWNVGLWRF
jgi:hypothetical protein